MVEFVMILVFGSIYLGIDQKVFVDKVYLELLVKLAFGVLSDSDKKLRSLKKS